MPANEIGLLTAFGAGIVSTLSPCVLPLVPAYVATVSATSTIDNDQENHNQMSVLFGTLTFIFGFTSVFVLLGLSATSFGRMLNHNQAILVKISGIVIVVMAIFILVTSYAKNITLLKEFKFNPRISRFKRIGPFLTGCAFALGWTPCIGPILASILAYASTQSNVVNGALLLGIYSLGVSIPFLLATLVLEQISPLLHFLKVHSRKISVSAGILMLALGGLLVMGQLNSITIFITSF